MASRQSPINGPKAPGMKKNENKKKKEISSSHLVASSSARPCSTAVIAHVYPSPLVIVATAEVVTWPSYI